MGNNGGSSPTQSSPKGFGGTAMVGQALPLDQGQRLQGGLTQMQGPPQASAQASAFGSLNFDGLSGWPLGRGSVEFEPRTLTARSSGARLGRGCTLKDAVGAQAQQLVTSNVCRLLEKRGTALRRIPQRQRPSCQKLANLASLLGGLLKRAFGTGNPLVEERQSPTPWHCWQPSEEAVAFSVTGLLPLSGLA